VFSFQLPPVVAWYYTLINSLKAGRLRVRFPIVSLEFFIDIILPPPHYGPGVDSASNRNQYQDYFLGVKAAGA